MCVPWESNPQPFALLTQCSTTEPHRNIVKWRRGACTYLGLQPSKALITTDTLGFECTVKYRTGQCNIVPDTLSRSFPEPSSLDILTRLRPKDSSSVFATSPVEWSDIAKAQQEDAAIQGLVAEAQSTAAPNPSRIHCVMKNVFLFRGISRGQLVISTALRALWTMLTTTNISAGQTNNSTSLHFLNSYTAFMNFLSFSFVSLF